MPAYPPGIRKRAPVGGIDVHRMDQMPSGATTIILTFPPVTPLGSERAAEAQIDATSPERDYFLSSTPKILYVSDCIFLPSRLTGQMSLAFSPENSTWTSSTMGARQLR